jgi:cytoskeletal protein CcmA (bactofilin family)
MFRKKETKMTTVGPAVPLEKVTTVLGSGTTYKGSLSGSGGVRIEGAFEGEIAVRGMLVIGTTGKVTCPHVRANAVIVAGALRGDITAEKVEIRSSGRVWGDVVTAAFSTEEGAFLRGQIQMEEKVDVGVALLEKTDAEPDALLQEHPEELKKTVRSTAENGSGFVDASGLKEDVLEAQPMMRMSEEQQIMGATQHPEVNEEEVAYEGASTEIEDTP